MSSAATTARGRATRRRIVRAASDLIRERGSAATSLDDVIKLSGQQALKASFTTGLLIFLHQNSPNVSRYTESKSVI